MSAPGKGWKLNRSKPALLAELLSQDCRDLAELRPVSSAVLSTT